MAAKHSDTTYAILGLLTTDCHTGYDIKQMMDTSLNHFWKISYGQIYPTLKKLVEDGWAVVTDTAQESKPDKKNTILRPKECRRCRPGCRNRFNRLHTYKNEFCSSYSSTVIKSRTQRSGRSSGSSRCSRSGIRCTKRSKIRS